MDRAEKKPEPDARVYVSVAADFNAEGILLPRVITWEDGTRYVIDKVLDIRPSWARKAGGQGDRYTVRIGGKETYLFFERNGSCSGNNLGRWFVERRSA